MIRNHGSEAIIYSCVLNATTRTEIMQLRPLGPYMNRCFINAVVNKRLSTEALENRFKEKTRKGLGCSNFEAEAVLETVKEVSIWKDAVTKYGFCGPLSTLLL